MVRGLIGKKLGMTQIFDKEGNLISVTAIETGPCFVLEVKDSPRKKIKLGFEPLKESRVKKPDLGFFKKIGVAPTRHIKEFEIIDVDRPAPEGGGEKDAEKKDEKKKEEAKKSDDKSADTGEYKVGQEIKADLFRTGDYVNVSGFSIGKGFQGGMKRWNWKGGPDGHGSMHHRRVGSIGASAYPSRTFRGRPMPGQMGNKKVTVENLRVMEVDVENNVILVDGAVPGKKDNYVMINLSKKKKYQSLDEKTVIHVVKRNPMKQSKSKAKGKK